MGAYVNVGAERPGFLLLKEIPGRPKVGGLRVSSPVCLLIISFVAVYGIAASADAHRVIPRHGAPVLSWLRCLIGHYGGCFSPYRAGFLEASMAYMHVRYLSLSVHTPR